MKITRIWCKTYNVVPNKAVTLDKSLNISLEEGYDYRIPFIERTAYFGISVASVPITPCLRLTVPPLTRSIHTVCTLLCFVVVWYQGVVSLTFRELSNIISRNLCTAEIVLLILLEFQAKTLYVCPKPCFGMLWAHVQSFSLKFSL